MVAIIDIDFTLADAGKRYAVAGKPPPRSRKGAMRRWLNILQTQENLLADPPIEAVKRLVISIQHRFDIVYVTGRSEMYREVTAKWLAEHGLPKGPLIMRSDEDWRSASGYKTEAVRRIKEIYGKSGLAIDDDYDGDCSEMYLKHGYVHLKVVGGTSGTSK